MRVAVLSDIHGYSLALERVIADLEQQQPLDAVVVAGDLVESGPAPAEALSILREQQRNAGWRIIQGNTDRDLVTSADDPSASDAFTIEAIGPEGLDFLANLPFSERITPPGGTSPEDDLLVVHANPRDQDRALDPELSEEEVRDLLAGERAAVIAFGHIHIAYVRQLPETLLVDVSAVGNPKDRDLRCKYGLLTWDDATRQWSAELRRLGYPLAETEAQIMASGLPKPKKTLKKLKQASYDD